MLSPEDRAQRDAERQALGDYWSGDQGEPFVLERHDAYCVCDVLFPWFWAKLVVLGFLGFFNAGWYSILKAQLYSTMPERSGLAITVNNISGIAGAVIPFSLGVVAQYFGLSLSMWLLLLGPIALIIGIPLEKPIKD